MKKLSFTLAEVLITLVIIGIIASLTIPTLMQNTQGEQYKSAFKKAISTLNQALELNYALDGRTAADYSGNEDLVANMFVKRMNVMQPDGTKYNSALAPDVNLAGVTAGGCTTTANSNTFTTMDGMIFCVTSGFVSDQKGEDTQCDVANTKPCTTSGSGATANIIVDVNGFKGPNIMTTKATNPRDIYQAMIFAQKVVPWGSAAQQIMYDSESGKTGTKGAAKA